MVVLVGLVGNDVDCNVSASWARIVRHTKAETRQRTKHVTLPILAATLVGNVSRDTHVGKCQILDGEVGRVQTTDDSESTALVDVKAELLQLLAKAGQLKVVKADLGTVQSQICNRESSVSTKIPCGRE